jgi:hypothetical protein
MQLGYDIRAGPRNYQRKSSMNRITRHLLPLPTFECGARHCVEAHGNEISATRVLAFGACARKSAADVFFTMRAGEAGTVWKNMDTNQKIRLAVTK